MSRHFRYLLLALTFTFLFSACEKKRRTRFVQGQGENLYFLEDFDKKNFVLETGKVLSQGIVTSNASSIEFGKNAVSIINTQPRVEYRSDVPVVDLTSVRYEALPLYAQAHSRYQLVSEFVGKRLMIFKVGEKLAIPSNEWTYAQTLPNGMLKVPFMSYAVKFYTIERKKDDRGKSTNEISTFEKQFRSEAQHFTVDLDSAKAFEELDKKRDVFPAEFFNSKKEWNYLKSLVDIPVSAGGPPSKYEMGMVSAQDRVTFSPTRDFLVGYSINQVEQASPDLSFSQRVLLPVEWVDYKVVDFGDDAGLKEIADYSRPWNERKFIRLRFAGVDQTTSVEDATVLKRLEVDDNYFSFHIYKASESFEDASDKDVLRGVTYHYSFYNDGKITAKDEGLQYPLEDTKYFGFFQTVQKNYYSSELIRREEFDRLLRAARYYPKDNKITFYLSVESTNDEVAIQAFREAVNAWNDAFKAAGTQITVEFSNERKRNGDARYNVINIYPENRKSSLLGYGPTLQNPVSGEIISGGNHIYLAGFRSRFREHVRRFVYESIGAYRSQKLPFLERTLQGSGASEGFYSLAGINLSANTGSAMLGALPGPSTGEVASPVIANESVPVALKPTEQAAFKIDANGACSMTGQTAYFFDVVANYCGNGADIEGTSKDRTFYNYLADLRNQVGETYEEGERTYLPGEKEALESCANILVQRGLTDTMVHEFGHIFGLRHNFAGTSDKRHANADPAVTDPKDRVSTSVMDYADYWSPRPMRPQSYDIEAIRYAYSRKVRVVAKGDERLEKPTYSYVDLKNGQAIDDALKGTNWVLDRHAYCTDQDFHYARVDPMCEQRDRGNTATQAVAGFIEDMIGTFSTLSKRVDQARLRNSLNLSADATTKQFQRFISYWRSLIDDPSDVKSRKLDGFNEAQYAALIAKGYASAQRQDVDSPSVMKSFAEEFKDYEQAQKLALTFTENVIFQPIRHCFVVDVAEHPKAIYAYEFEKVRESVYRENKKTVSSCNNEFVKTYILKLLTEEARKQLGANPIFFEAGSLASDLYESLDPKESSVILEDNVVVGGMAGRSPIELGLFESRRMFATFISQDVSPSLSFTQGRGYAPIQQVDVANSFMQRLSTRAIGGIDLKDFGIEILKEKIIIDDKTIDPNFTNLVRIERLNTPASAQGGNSSGWYVVAFNSESSLYLPLITSTKARISSNRAISYSFRGFQTEDALKRALALAPYAGTAYQVLTSGTEFLVARNNSNPEASEILRKLKIIASTQTAFQRGIADATPAELSYVRKLLRESLLKDRVLPETLVCADDEGTAKLTDIPEGERAAWESRMSGIHAEASLYRLAMQNNGFGGTNSDAEFIRGCEVSFLDDLYRKARNYQMNRAEMDVQARYLSALLIQER